MEIIIILLIAVEVCLALIREGHEVASMVSGLFSAADEQQVEALADAAENENAFFGQAVDKSGVLQAVRDQASSAAGGADDRRLV